MNDQTSGNRIANHYRQTDLAAKITAAFESAGRRISNYTDTEFLDEFHIRGREATRELARLGGVTAGMNVLDLGCGIGGPARMLAAEFGCKVTGIDLMSEYCRAAEMITEHAGLSNQVRFQQGDMTALSFENQSFDAIWTLHTIMNIEDKSTLFDSVRRILKPGGRFLIYEVCAGNNSPPVFPVPWAGDRSTSFLLTPDKLRFEIGRHGFEEDQWQDVSDAAVKWFRAIKKSRASSMQDYCSKKKNSSSKKNRQHPGISILLGKNAVEKSENVFLNLLEDRIRTVFGVFRRP